MNFLILNGPNLNLLGAREPGVYGHRTFDDFYAELRNHFSNHSFLYFQSNHEGTLIDKLHEYGFQIDGIILNAGAFTHTSIALADAIHAISTPVIEVHISNVFKRESFRHHSYLSEACLGSISGFGLDSYRLAVEALIQHKQND
ncbi:type II 3-dehydroquinate dehydratase [Microbacter margulisiae]|uniref:3-dehydroquinate dehydratase n=1 Tax=Microbacter margulisiae TaxID=1350067 RepID=A0A7W5DPG6_9PORP|nr:type II 3-dehydroquinate dehydratase [Microbacter margulisiae]MBB3186159.1 3-dehydroquinate dehydratase-2 [Microbacter margulisiae]